MDIALALDALVPAARYFGSLTANSLADYEALDWQDDRPKPAWEDLSGAGLAAIKLALKQMIDQQAERVRLNYITPGAGQAMTYQQKTAEARALAVDADPDPTSYPLLSAEIGITAPSLAEVAAVVLNAYQQWQLIGAAIEAARLGGKSAIDNAADRDDALRAFEDIVWPATIAT